MVAVIVAPLRCDQRVDRLAVRNIFYGQRREGSVEREHCTRTRYLGSLVALESDDEQFFNCS